MSDKTPRVLNEPRSLILLATLAMALMTGLIWMDLRSVQSAICSVIGLGGLLVLWMLFRRLENPEQQTRQDKFISQLVELSHDLHDTLHVPTWTYRELNSAEEKLLGYERKAWMEGGLSFFLSLVHPDDKTHVQLELSRFLEVRTHSRQEEPIQEDTYRIRTKWEEYRWFRTRRRVFSRNPDGSPLEVLEVSHDITEQRGFEIALVQAQEFESLGTLARRLAHDLNNILMGIQGYAELGLMEGQGVDALRQNLVRIRESSHRADGICRQMLAYAGRSRSQIGRHRINDSIREGLPLAESLLPENVDLVLNLESDLPQANVDPNQVRYALLHLIVNAVESMGSDQGEIEIRTHLCRLGGDGDPLAEGLMGDFIAVTVRDTGAGMGEETLAGIADPFFRTKHPGRGLGLLTVKGIAAEHRGALHVETSPGHGVHCTLYFPIAEKELALSATVEVQPLVGAKGVVLLVDDEPTIRSVLREGLEAAGFQVVEGVDGVDGFGAFVRHRASIVAVMVDLTMPRMNGDEVVQEIRKLEPNIPIILMSGYSQDEAMANLGQEGISAFLSKPCSVKESLETLRRVIPC